MNLASRIVPLIAGLLAQAAVAAVPLPALQADPTQTSVSGLSSGAFMAVQYEVAYSASVVGAGIVAGGPYYCAGGQMLNAGICMGQVPGIAPNASLMLGAARRFAAAGQIDPLSHLQTHRIYVFSGTRDTVVHQKAVDATVSFYKQAGVAANNVQYVNTVAAGHAFITPDFGNACSDNAAPYVSHCSVSGSGYDQAGAMLQQIYGKLNPPAAAPSGQIVAFDQREFAAAGTGMAAQAFVYVPASCRGGGCKVHVALHGCQQSAAKVGDDVYAKAGYNRWADSNKIVVLYPQVDASTIPLNPQGCWDWFAYTGPAYATHDGVQMKAIKAMVDRLTTK
ncbi:extracellular catalytic domain type 2 short-chain-length polyhydroxyalkanoate depolymerase [Paludibacterium yongneupense]|uniref:extracellular catalytic domain type 2 short-chain-length polyhydroxyalkanoate depolymerase n=1 Tax=Paludibacterium yongneupense TaxID=400061 RepID=UPI000420D9BB|nr:PHB depolymerase family esterase [Paludibacterium yongneupense]